MKIKYAISDYMEHRISFSREELLFMINDLKKTDPRMKYLLVFLEKLEEILTEESK